MRDFIETYLKYTDNTESPKSFHLWTALSLIAATMRRRCYLNRGSYKLFPNLYVFFVTRSGFCRKGVAMGIGVNLLKQIEGINIVYERASPEGLMDRMNKLAPEFHLSSTKLTPDGSVFIFIDELSNFFGKSTYVIDLISILTQAYSCNAVVEFSTRNKGVCRVSNPYICMLAGTTPKQVGEIFPSITLYSGYLGRVIPITGKRRRRVGEASLVDELEPELTKELKRIARIKGEFIMHDKAHESFINWYEKDMPEEPPIGMLSAFYERYHDHILKIAIAKSASRDSSMIITEEDFFNAKEILDTTVRESGDILIQNVGISKEGTMADEILKAIRGISPERMSATVLMSRFYSKMKNFDEFNGILDMLVKAKKIKASANERDVYYEII